MSRRNFKVETAENGQATLVKIDKTPTGKVKTIKDKEILKKEREEQYKNFRISALKRRGKRMGLSDEEIAKKVEELIKQLNSPTDYDIVIMFNPADFNLVKQALLNEDISWKLLVSSYGFLMGDKELVDDLRKILPPSAKIYPYVKRKPPILPAQDPPKKEKKPKNRAAIREAAKTAKKARKAAKIQAHHDRGLHAKQQKEERNKKARKLLKAKMLFEKRAQKAAKKRSGIVVQMKSKKSSNASKKASTSIKQAA